MKKITILTSLVIAFFSCNQSVMASNYPSKPIKLIAPYSPGGLTDILARSLAQEMSNRLGQSVVVENKSGAGGIIGTDFVAKSEPDGYTLALVGQGLASVNPSLYAKLPYNTSKDFEPVALFSRFSLVLVANPNKPPVDAKDFLNRSKVENNLSYGSAGNASTAHLTMAMLNMATNSKSIHIPYKGEAAAFNELMGAQFDTMFGTVGGALPFIKTGKLKPIAVADKNRSPLLPDVPTLDEQGVKGFDAYGWYAILAPIKTDTAIVNKLNTIINDISMDEGFKKKMLDRGMETMKSSPATARKTIEDEIIRWKDLIGKTNISVE